MIVSVLRVRVDWGTGSRRQVLLFLLYAMQVARVRSSAIGRVMLSVLGAHRALTREVVAVDAAGLSGLLLMILRRDRPSTVACRRLLSREASVAVVRRIDDLTGSERRRRLGVVNVTLDESRRTRTAAGAHRAAADHRVAASKIPVRPGSAADLAHTIVKVIGKHLRFSPVVALLEWIVLIFLLRFAKLGFEEVADQARKNDDADQSACYCSHDRSSSRRTIS